MLAKGIFHTVRCPAQYISWGSWWGGQWSLFKDGLGIVHGVVSNCIMHHLVCMYYY